MQRYCRCMTDELLKNPPAADDSIPTDCTGILCAIASATVCIDSPEYAGRAAAIHERLRAGERVAECDRAAALGMPWPAYALIRGVQLARDEQAIVHLDDDAGNPVIWIEVEGGSAEFRDANQKPILRLGIPMIDQYLAGWSSGVVH